jgi:serine phosphatase RsbU (regulator of sigma subunit)
VANERLRTLLTTGAYAALVIALLAGGGLYVRGVIFRSFETADALRTTRALAYDALRYMLDEETGVGGFAATHEPEFLAPYRSALGPFRTTVARLTARVDALGVPEAGDEVDNLATTNAAYLKTVATPLMDVRDPDPTAVERRGKALVDRFRAAVAAIDDRLTAREQIVDAQVRGAVDRIGLLVGSAIVLVLVVSLLYAQQQAALTARAEERRREADVLRSAYAAEKRIADTLQEAFVQRPLPTHPTFRFSATYVPATEETRVGGDWYDAFELPGNRVLFTIGDVTGHGIAAAVTMNRVRQTLISSALLDPLPARMLARVSKELYADGSLLVTAVAGFADADTYEFVYASAGHPPPLLMEPGRPPRLLECGSLPLGAIADNEYRTFRVQSVPGATLVLYTDGAIEHSRDVIEGETILLAAAAAAAEAQPPDPATFIRNAVFAGRDVGDDVAILTIGFAADPAVGLRISADRAQAAFSGRVGRLPQPGEQHGQKMQRIERGNKVA